MKKLKPAAHYIVVLQIRSQKLLITVIFVLIFLNGYLIFLSEHICVCVYLAPYVCISLPAFGIQWETTGSYLTSFNFVPPHSFKNLICCGKIYLWILFRIWIASLLSNSYQVSLVFKTWLKSTQLNKRCHVLQKFGSPYISRCPVSGIAGYIL